MPPGQVGGGVLPRRRRSARVYLLGLIAAAVIPVWMFAAYLLVSYALSAQKDYRRQAVQLAAHATAAIDAELDTMLIRLDGLARSVELASGDLRGLHEAARRLVADTEQTLMLRDFGTRRLIDTRFEFGSDLPPAPALSEAERADFLADRSRVSDVDTTSPSGPSVSVARPVSVRGDASAILVMSTPTSRFHEVLAGAVPEGWAVGVGDRLGVYVTRSRRHEEVTGKPGLPEYLEKAVGSSGTFTAKNAFDETLLAGYQRSPRSGWLFGANIPLATVEAPFRQSLYGVLGLGAVALFISLLFAYAVGQRMTRAAEELASRAMALGSGQPLQPLDSGLTEFAHVGDALLAAERMLAERTRELEAVLETVPAAVWFTYDPAARLVIRNRFAAELMGLPLDDHRYGTPDQVIETVAVKDGKTVERDDRPLSRAMRGEHTDHEEFSYRLPNGVERFLLSSARPILDEAARVIGAVQISLDITERKRGEEQRRLLAMELNHRVKNNLAIIQALAQQTIRNASSLPEAGIALGARLAALGHAHDILTRNAWAAGDLREAVEAAVLTQAPEGRVDISGPAVSLPPGLVMSVTLTMHELTTNAIKYGALSNATGRVAIGWRETIVAERDAVEILWVETGGPPVRSPSGRGFGSRLLKRITASEGGSVVSAYEKDGLRCTLVLPIEK